VLSAFQNSLRSLIKVRRRALRRTPHLKGKEMRFALALSPLPWAGLLGLVLHGLAVA